MQQILWGLPLFRYMGRARPLLTLLVPTAEARHAQAARWTTARLAVEPGGLLARTSDSGSPIRARAVE